MNRPPSTPADRSVGRPGALRDRAILSCILASATVLLVASAGGAQESLEALGPLRISEQNSLYRLLGSPEADPSDPICLGALQIELSTSYSNVFEGSSGEGYGHLFDLEQMQNAVTVRYGVGDDLEVGGRVAVLTGWGGFLDGFISGFHRVFGLPNGGREKRPEGEYDLYLMSSAGESVEIDLSDRSVWFEDLQLFAKWQALGARDGRGSLSIQGTVRGAMGPMDAGRIDGSAVFLGRWSAASWHFHGSLGLAALNAPQELESVAKQGALFFSVAVERNLRSRLSLLAQLGGGTSYVDGFDKGDLHGVPMNLAFGIAGLTDGGWGWQVSFAEDILADGPSVDFTVDLEISKVVRGWPGVSGPEAPPPGL